MSLIATGKASSWAAIREREYRPSRRRRDEHRRAARIRPRTENGDRAADDVGIVVGKRAGELGLGDLGAGEREDPQGREAPPLVGVAAVRPRLVDDATAPVSEQATCRGLGDRTRRRRVGGDPGERPPRQARERVLRGGAAREPAIEDPPGGVERQARQVEERPGDDHVRRDADPDEDQRAEGERVRGKPGTHV